jgi:hypothetical protein
MCELLNPFCLNRKQRKKNEQADLGCHFLNHQVCFSSERTRDFTRNGFIIGELKMHCPVENFWVLPDIFTAATRFVNRGIVFAVDPKDH